MKLVYSNHQSIIGIINHDTDEPFLQIDHYYYIESTRFNQSSPVIFDSMKKSIILSRPWTFMPLFPIIYYGEAFRLVTIFSQGTCDEMIIILYVVIDVGSSYDGSGGMDL
ncbi:unnamed protein product [Schistosoma spindalis]|nr:unnamed protein product [Schistosoma spindale]